MDLRAEELPSSVISLCIYMPLRRGFAEYTLAIPSPVYYSYLSMRVCISALQKMRADFPSGALSYIEGTWL